MSAFSRRWSVRQLVVGMAASAMALFVAGSTQAQFGEAAGIAESMQQDYFRRDIVVMSQGLNLDSTQRIIVDALFADYEAAFEHGRQGVKDRFENMRNELQIEDPKRVMKLVFKPFKDWGADKKRLGEEFLENVRVVLNEDQQQLWPAVERQLYRQRKLHKGRLSGETLNLFDVVRDLHLDERTAQQIQPAMEAYDIALDQALRNRENSNAGEMLDSLTDEDHDKSLVILQKIITLQVAVRNVNDEYIDHVAQALPADIAAKFTQAALERAYPRIYREHPVQRLFREAKAIEGLERTVTAAVVEIEAAFVAELTAMNLQVRDGVRHHEPVEHAARADDFAKRMSGQTVEPKADPTRELFLKRDELARTYAKQLQTALTPAQYATLPGAMRWVENPQDPDARQVVPGPMQKPRSRGEGGIESKMPGIDAQEGISE